MNKAIVLYAAGESLASSLEELKIPVISVPREQYRLPLAVILGKRKPAPNASPYEGEELPEPVAVLHGIGGRELDRVLDALRGRVQLKAITTPMNINWNAATLFRNLSQERAALSGRK